MRTRILWERRAGYESDAYARDEPSYARKNVIHDESRAADVDIVAP